MITDWQDLKRTRKLDLRAESSFKSKEISFRNRIDAVWLFLVLSIFSILILFWLGFVLVGQRSGLFAPPPVRPLRDARILTNVRGNIAREPLLDAVFHSPDKRIYISGEGGKLHRYNPYPKLWATISTGLEDKLIDPDLVLLRSGSGIDPRSNRFSEDPGPEILWAQTRRRGLVYSRNGKDWNVVVGDSSFVGSKGTPVTQEHLTAAAVSGDRQWLLVGTREEGIGIYYLESRRWLSLEPDVFKALPSEKVTHIAWFQNYFWIGGPSGLAALKMEEGRPHITKIDGINGKICDLEVDSGGWVWVLEKTKEYGTAAQRLRLGKLRHPRRAPVWVVEEQGIYRELKLEDLNFARYWDDHLVVAGEAGIFSYDTRLHGWKRHFTKRVLSTLALPGGKGFYFGYAGGIGKAEGNFYEYWNAPAGNTSGWLMPINGEKIIKLRCGKADEVLALCESGNVFAAAKGKVKRVFESGRIKTDPKRFQFALSFDNTVLFIGKQEAAAHNIVTRSYQNVPFSSLPHWLTTPRQKKLTEGNTTYIASHIERNTELYGMPTAEAAELKFQSAVQLDTLPGKVKCFRNWGDKGIVLIGGSTGDQVIGYSPKKEMIGPKEHRLNGRPFSDAAPYGDGLMVAALRGLWRYDYSSRAWEAFSTLPGGTTPTELVNSGGQLFIKSDDKQLFRMLGKDNFTPAIGGIWNGSLSGDALSDAAARRGQLYLAGNGHIYLYEPGARTFVNAWRPAFGGTVKIKGFINDEPLALCRERVYIGQKQLDGYAGRVLNLNIGDNYIWTVREKNGGTSRYLKGYPVNDPFGGESRCFFQNPAAGAGVTKIEDAVEIPGSELIAVSTNLGLRFYSPGARSWAACNSPGGQLYLLFRHLAAARRVKNGFQLNLFELDSITLPGSCADAPITLTGNSISARAFTVDKQNGRLFYVNHQGEVLEWNSGSGSSSQLLPGPGAPPPTDELKRIFARCTAGGEGHLLFTTNTDVIFYDLKKRTWNTISLDLRAPGGKPLPLRDITVTSDGDREIVVAKGKDGKIFQGTFPSLPATAPLENDTVKMKQVYSPGTGFNASGDRLQDVQERKNGTWTFVLDDRIKYYNPASRTWRKDVVVDNIYGKPAFTAFASRGVLVSGNGRTWWVAHQGGEHPESFARYDHQPGETTALDAGGTIWTLDGNSNVFKLELPDKENRYGKKILHEKPFYLEPGKVNRAFRWKEFILFDTGDRLRFFDFSLRRPVPSKLEKKDFSGIKEAWDDGFQLWLTDSRNRLLRLNKTTATDKPLDVERFSMKLSRIVFRGNRRHWVYAAGTGWRYWDGTEFIAPTARKDIKFFVTEETEITAIDDQSYPYHWDDALRKGPLQLPSFLTGDNSKALWRGREKDWWAVSGGHLYHLSLDECPNPRYHPAPSPSPKKTDAKSPDAAGPDRAQDQRREPKTIPCYKVKSHHLLPASCRGKEIIQARCLDESSITIVTEDGVTVTVKKKLLGGYNIDESRDAPKSAAPGLKNEWPSLKQWMVKMPDGRDVFDPVKGFEVNGQDVLLSRRPSGAQQLAPKGIININTLPPPLDAGWLKWDRSRKVFRVKVLNSYRDFDRKQFIRDKKLIFEEVDALMPVSTTLTYAANRHGIWRYGQAELPLTHIGIMFQPVEWTQPVTAAHGYFITQTGLYDHNGRTAPKSGQDYRAAFGDVVLSEKIMERKITGKYKIYESLTGKTGTANAFANSGFTWDRNKRGLALSDDGLLVHSNAGIHPLNKYTGFESPPAPGRLHSEDHRKVYFATAKSWYRRQGLGGWKRNASDPAANRVLVDNGTWKWERKKGIPAIQLTGKPYRFRLVSTPQGLSFTADQLVDAAVYDDRLCVMTNAFFETPDPWAQLMNFQAPRYSFQSFDRLRTIIGVFGQNDLIGSKKNTHYAWNDSSKKFVPVTRSNNPNRKRLLVSIPADNPRLRIYSTSNRIAKELKVREINGSESWVPFDFENNRFPFDVVTSIAVRGNELYVGTKAGLQVYRANGRTGLEDMTELYRLSRRSPGYLVEVKKVGIPVGNPQTVRAKSPEGCFELNGGGSIRPCARGVNLSKRQRLQNSYWRFFKEGIQLVGNYKDINGRFSSENIRIENGRFPHDRIKDIATFDNKAFTMWNSGWISVHPVLSLGLNGSVANYNKRRIGPRRFIIVPTKAAMEKTIVPRGIYFESRDRRVWQFDGSAWSEIKKTLLVNGILEYADRPPIINRGRLRLLQPKNASSSREKQGLTFEQRTLQGEWRPLPWKNGRVAIDKWSECLCLANKVWAATPSGIVAFTRRSDARLILDPDRFILIREPRVKNDIPGITEMEGDVFGVTIRCKARSEYVYRGLLDGKADDNVFKRLDDTEDPFVNRTMVKKEDNGFWEWKRIDCKDFHPGQLTAELRGEKIELIGGRFNFDTLNTIAFFKENDAEIGTDSGGYYRIPREDLHVRSFVRPQMSGVDTAAVTAVRLTRQNNRPILGLKTARGDYIQWGKNRGVIGRVQNFPEYKGEDGFWRYFKEDKGLNITASKSIGGTSLRQLENGRFTDDIVLGLPVTEKNETGTRYLIPTRSGVLRLGGNFKTTEMYSKAHLNLPDGEAPTTLFIANRDNRRKILYVTKNRFCSLTEPGEPYPTLKLRLPDEVEVFAVEEGPQDFVRVRWKHKNQHCWTLINYENPGKKLNSQKQYHQDTNNLYIDISRFNKYKYYRMKWGKNEPWMQIHLAPTHMQAFPHGASEQYKLDFPEPVQMLTPVIVGETLCLIGKKELWEINLEHAIVQFD